MHGTNVKKTVVTYSVQVNSYELNTQPKSLHNFHTPNQYTYVRRRRPLLITHKIIAKPLTKSNWIEINNRLEKKIPICLFGI